MDKQSSSNQPQVHGIVYLHGAGMPDDDTKFVGDPLAEIADGLIDVFNAEGYLRDHYRLGVSAVSEERGTSIVNMSIHRKAKEGEPEEHLYLLRMCDVLWKPTQRQKGPLEFLPIFWMWALAFNSFAQTKEQGWSQSEKEEQKHRFEDYRVRLVIADLGLVLAGLESWLVFQLAKLIKQYTGFCQIKIPDNDLVNSLCSAQGSDILALFVPLVASFSIVAAVLLALLGWFELADRMKKSEDKTGRVHGSIHQMVMIATTAWLAIFIAPILILGYYAKEIVQLIIGVGLIASIVGVAVLVHDATRGFYLIGIALVIWVLSRMGNLQRRFEVSNRQREAARRTPKKTETQANQERLTQIKERGQDIFLVSRHWCMKWFRVLLVVAGAPLIIGLLGFLYLFSLIPIIGKPIGEWRDSVAQAGIWIHVKDIDMYLTDSARAAAARYLVEEKIVKIDKPTKETKSADAIHIFAHSLGTVVAYDTLVHLGRGDGGLIRDNNKQLLKKIKTLITFGSPLNKMRKLAEITERAVKIGEQGPVSMLDYDRFGGRAVLTNFSGKTRWLNSYALDDVVSDVMTEYVDPNCHLDYTNGQVEHSNKDCKTVHPEEMECLTATELSTAHGAYWKDKDFWYKVLQTMGIDVPSQV